MTSLRQTCLAFLCMLSSCFSFSLLASNSQSDEIPNFKFEDFARIQEEVIAWKESGKDPRSLLFVLDLHGVLINTHHQTPGLTPIPRLKFVELAHFLKEEGTNVAIANTSEDHEAVYDCVWNIGLKNFLSDVTLTFIDAQREIKRNGNVISARYLDRPNKLFTPKAFAAKMSTPKDVKIEHVYFFGASTSSFIDFWEDAEMIFSDVDISAFFIPLPGKAQIANIPQQGMMRISIQTNENLLLNEDLEIQFYLNHVAVGKRFKKDDLVKSERIGIDEIVFAANHLDTMEIHYRVFKGEEVLAEILCKSDKGKSTFPYQWSPEEFEEVRVFAIRLKGENSLTDELPKFSVLAARYKSIWDETISPLIPKALGI